MKTYKNLFFDLDRTLWDFETSSVQVFEILYNRNHLESYGIPDADAFHNIYLPINESLWDLYRKGSIDKEGLRTQRFRLALQHYNINNEELAEHLDSDYIFFSPRVVNLFPYTIEALTYLKQKYHLHLITNGFREVQEQKIVNSSLKPYFDTLTVSEEVGVKKPDPGIFYYAMNRIGATPEESIMIGDDLKVDIEGAQNANMDQVYFNVNKTPHTETVTYEINSLKQLMELF